MADHSGVPLHVMMIMMTSVLGTARPPLPFYAPCRQVLWHFYRLLVSIFLFFLFWATDDAGVQSVAASFVFFPAFHQLNGLHLSLSSSLSLCLFLPCWRRRDFSLLLFHFFY